MVEALRKVKGAWIWLTFLAVVLPFVTSAAAAGKPRNLIVITLDTTRSDFIEAYSTSTPSRQDGILSHTPVLDAIAKQGTRFDLAISSAAVTPVSHASILTGLDNHEHGLRVLSAPSGYRLPDRVQTLATILDEQGYRTVAVHSAFPVAGVFGFGRGFDVFESLETQLPDGTREGRWDIKTFQRRSDETTALTIGLLEQIETPYFLWVHYWDPHDPWKVPPEAFSAALASHLTKGSNPSVLTRDQKRRLLYAGEVAYMDAQIGKLMEGLGGRGLLDDTLIVVVSDHGQGLGDHDWLHHRILYQEQIRVPLIVSIPGQKQVPAVAELVRSKDILPTVLDYMGIAAPQSVSGRTLRPLIEGEPDTPRIAFANQINGFDVDASMVAHRPHDDFVYVAMDREWKLLYRPNHPEASELYHLAEDPVEAQNLYADQHPHAIRLKQSLATARPWVNEPFVATPESADMAQMHTALEALGYLEKGEKQTDFPSPDWRWTCPDRPGIVSDDSGAAGECGTPLIPFVSRATAKKNEASGAGLTPRVNP